MNPIEQRKNWIGQKLADMSEDMLSSKKNFLTMFHIHLMEIA